MIILCILLSAFFSSIETAFSFVNEIRIHSYADDGNKKAKNVLYIIKNFDKALTAILICNNVVNLGCSSLATVVCYRLFGDIGTAVATGATTLLVLTFGEVLPKCLAKEHAEAYSLATAGILKSITIILSPIVFFFVKLKGTALKVAGTKDEQPSVTEDELKQIVENIEDEGVLEEEESEMVQSVLDFDDKTVLEVLTPRVDMTAVDIRVFPFIRKPSTTSSVFCTRATTLKSSPTVTSLISASLSSPRTSYSITRTSQKL